jgi:hypothetical protein
LQRANGYGFVSALTETHLVRSVHIDEHFPPLDTIWDMTVYLEDGRYFFPPNFIFGHPNFFFGYPNFIFGHPVFFFRHPVFFFRHPVFIYDQSPNPPRNANPLLLW